MNGETIRLGDLLELVAMGPFGSDLKTDNFRDSGVPVIRGGNLSGFYVSDTDLVFVTEEKADSLSRSVARPGDLVITHRGTLGQVSMVPRNGTYDRFLVSQSQMLLRVDTEKVIPEYLTYWMRSKAGQNSLLAFAVQTGVPALAQPTKSIKALQMVLPSIAGQRAIAEVLGALDDKIAANRQALDTSDALLRTRFHHLELSDKTLGDIARNERATVRSGAEVESGRYVALEHFDKRHLWLQQSSDLSDATSAKTIFKENDTLFGKLRPYFHKVARAPFAGICSTDVLVLRALQADNAAVVAGSASSDAVIAEAVQASNGTRMPRAKWTDISKCRVPDPSAPATRAFIDLADAISQRMAAAIRENTRLARTRDELLPALMSGRITVKDAESRVEKEV